ncbi:hypothetical protein F4777DRAFT_578797 [Nemania sp. FL0916]|nr:hypothetical protein F4777DRAFT_578797 [Nemania sp. FL0916]
MAKTRVCWTCWRKSGILIAKLVCCLIVLRYLINCEMIRIMDWTPLKYALCTTHAYLVLILMVPIARLAIWPSWYDEESPDEHCHVMDVPSKIMKEQYPEFDGRPGWRDMMLRAMQEA